MEPIAILRGMREVLANELNWTKCTRWDGCARCIVGAYEYVVYGSNMSGTGIHRAAYDVDFVERLYDDTDKLFGQYKGASDWHMSFINDAAATKHEDVLGLIDARIAELQGA